MKNQKGFTLIELAMFIAVLAIIVFVGVSGYNDYQEAKKEVTTQ